MTTNKPSFFEKANAWLKQSITIKLITIGILILLLLIPVSMVEDLIREREYRQTEAINEVSSKWGERQTIKGIVISVPYKTFEKVFDADNSEKFKLVESVKYAHFLPDELVIEGAIDPETRYRGIYEVIVYNSKLKISGNILSPDFSEWKINSEDILWENAFISLGISDLRSIQENISIKWNEKELFFNPGVETSDVIQNGISTRINLTPSGEAVTKYNFELNLDFNGSNSLNFIPLGKTTEVKIQSAWKNPSFDGAFLPDDRVVESKGFKAHWKVLHLNRNYPQKFRGNIERIDDSAFGLNLIVPVDEYQKSMRSAKYAVMFITLTFLIFFFIQILNKVRLHPIQYIIVGLALCVFYTLLIALSEHISFNFGYLISSLAIVGLITYYAFYIFKKRKLTILIGMILSGLYLFIFTIIQMEDYALLMGSAGLFLVLATIVFLSRKIDWYSINKADEEE